MSSMYAFLWFCLYYVSYGAEVNLALVYQQFIILVLNLLLCLVVMVMVIVNVNLYSAIVTKSLMR